MDKFKDKDIESVKNLDPEQAEKLLYPTLEGIFYSLFKTVDSKYCRHRRFKAIPISPETPVNYEQYIKGSTFEYLLKEKIPQKRIGEIGFELINEIQSKLWSPKEAGYNQPRDFFFDHVIELIIQNCFQTKQNQEYLIRSFIEAIRSTNYPLTKKFLSNCITKDYLINYRHYHEQDFGRMPIQQIGHYGDFSTKTLEYGDILEIILLLVRNGSYVDIGIKNYDTIPDTGLNKFLAPFIQLLKEAITPPASSKAPIKTVPLPKEVNGRRCVDGNTALHLALLNNNLTLAQAILEHPRVDIFIQNKAQIDSFQLAEKCADPEVLVLLYYRAIEFCYQNTNQTRFASESLHSITEKFIKHFSIFNQSNKEKYGFALAEWLANPDSHLYHCEFAYKLLNQLMPDLISPEKTKTAKRMLYRLHMELSSRSETKEKKEKDEHLKEMLELLFNTEIEFQIEEPVQALSTQYAFGDADPTTQKELEGVTSVNPKSFLILLEYVKKTNKLLKESQAKVSTLEQEIALLKKTVNKR